MKMEIVVKEIRPVETENGERRVEVLLSNGNTVTILPCYEGFQQTGCTTVEAQVTVKIAFRYNGWLHGKKR